jgi:hypothetical protein
MFLFERSTLGNRFNFCDDQVRPESHPRFLVVIFGGIVGYAGLADPRGSSQYPALMGSRRFARSAVIEPMATIGIVQAFARYREIIACSEKRFRVTSGR